MPRFKPWLILGMIFILGLVTGGALTFSLEHHFARPPGPQQMRRHMLTFLTRELNLTADQQTKIGPILDDAERQIRQIHRDEVGRVSKIMEAANSQITPLLTPEQQAQQKAMESERKKMFSGHMRPWGQPPHEGPGGPGPEENPAMPASQPPPGP